MWTSSEQQIRSAIRFRCKIYFSRGKSEWTALRFQRNKSYNLYTEVYFHLCVCQRRSGVITNAWLVPCGATSWFVSAWDAIVQYCAHACAPNQWTTVLRQFACSVSHHPRPALLSVGTATVHLQRRSTSAIVSGLFVPQFLFI